EQERVLMFSGSYNAGFLALRVGAVAEAFLQWWAQRLYRHCLLNQSGDHFVDQRWLNWVPALFENSYVLRETGVNAAMWNADDQPLSFRDNRFWVDQDTPLVFFHFSKVSLTDWSILFQVWISASPPSKELHLLVLLYRTLILQCYSRPGNERRNAWAYGNFSNGVRIADSLRKLLQNDYLWARWEDPFDTSHPDSFWNWLNSPVTPDINITNLFAHIGAGDNELVEQLPIEDKTQRAFKQFMNGAQSGNPHALDLIFYRQVLNNPNNCTLLTKSCLQTIPEHFLNQL
ncbi:MAG TPA: hypothetical protein PLV25_07880, partial [Opitutales bacterium]|nr:hypothetical protein [Opitutales bacterium]